MLGLNKNFSFLLLSIFVLAAFVACSQPAKNSVAINSPVIIPYLVKNPLEIIINEKTDVPEFYNRTITISGLLDKKIEESINENLGEMYKQTLEDGLPPYRGIRQVISENAKLTSNAVDSNMSFNYNNVASILIYGNRAYDNYTYVGIMNAYNVDLNTGEEISLKDIFADDVDYKLILNDYILEIIMKSNASEEDYFSMVGSGLKLVAPFKGISDNQKFFLSQGGLVLIFDYANPEFETGFYAANVYISFSELKDSIAIAKRFYDKDIDIYQSTNPPSFEFLLSGDSSNMKKQNNKTIDGISISQSLSYDKGIPNQAIDKAESLYLIDLIKFNEMRALAVTSDEVGSNFEQYVWVRITGNYTTVTRNTNLYYNGKWKSDTENFCYDELGNEVTLPEIFVSGYDYKSKIISALRNALNQMPSTSNYKAEDLYQNIEFAIGLSDISFTTIPIKSDPLSESPVYFALTFEEIGCENLTIFE